MRILFFIQVQIITQADDYLKHGIISHEQAVRALCA